MADPVTAPDEPELEPEDDLDLDPADDPEEIEGDQEPEPEPEPQPGPEPEPTPAIAEKTPSRGERRFQALNDRLKRQERELDELRQQRRQPDNMAAIEAQRQRDEALERETLDSMDPARIARFYSERAERRTQSQVQTIALNSADIADKADFRALCAEYPIYGRMAERVEARLQQIRRETNWGMNPQRAALARLMVGEDMEKRSKGVVTRQTRRAETEVRRQTARPAAPRGEVRATGSRTRLSEHEARAKRLDESGEL